MSTCFRFSHCCVWFKEIDFTLCSSLSPISREITARIKRDMIRNRTNNYGKVRTRLHVICIEGFHSDNIKTMNMEKPKIRFSNQRVIYPKKNGKKENNLLE